MGNGDGGGREPTRWGQPLFAVGLTVAVNLVAVAGFSARYAERVDQQGAALSSSIARREKQIEEQDRKLAELRNAVNANSIGVARVEYLVGLLLNLQDGIQPKRN